MKITHSIRGFIVLSIVAGLAFFTYTESHARRGSCYNKRQRCLVRCLVKAKRKAKRCKSKSLKKRSRCIKKAHKAGKRCLRKQKCPKAKFCYKQCKQSSGPLACYVKKGCANLQATCYSSCQIPLGESLKQCLTTTEAKLKSCKADSASYRSGCQGSCPVCS